MVLELQFTTGIVRVILLLIGVLAVCVGAGIQQLPAGAETPITIARTQQVHSIAIDSSGLPGLPVSELRGALETAIGAAVDPDTLARDREALRNVLLARGYLAARVGSPSVTFGPSGGAYVVFPVERGPLYRVRTVTFVGRGWDRAGVMTVGSGDEISAARVETARRNAERTLDRRGERLRVIATVREDAALHLVDVRFETAAVERSGGRSIE